jgi:NAD(P)-dependent dehydrogenase (short-subunit alcohol dehydrogenase family)
LVRCDDGRTDRWPACPRDRGGARGIGAAIAAKALAEGAFVSIIDLDQAAGNELLVALGAGERASLSAGDMRRASDIARALEAATKMFGTLNGLVNNAGRNVYADPVTMTEQEWEDVFAVDLNQPGSRSEPSCRR